MIVLHGFLPSGNVYKIRLLFAHLGIEHRRIEVAQYAGHTSLPAFRRINPIGKVPAVKFDDGRVLTESGAIMPTRMSRMKAALISRPTRT